MKIFLAAPFYGDDRNKETILDIITELEKGGNSVFCFMEHEEDWGQNKIEPSEIYSKTLYEISNSDIVVAYIEENCPGVAIEVGMATALNIEIYSFYLTSLKRVGAYKGVSTKYYQVNKVNELPKVIANKIPNNLNAPN